VVQSVTASAAVPAAAAAAPALLLLPSTRRTQIQTPIPTEHVRQAVKQQLCQPPLRALPLLLLLLLSLLLLQQQHRCHCRQQKWA
jgi:hypothetical protein